MSPFSLLVCVAIILSSAIFGIAPQLKTPDLPQPALVMIPVVVGEPMLPVVNPFHPRPVRLGGISDYAPPEFASLKDTDARKQAFYEYMLPKIYTANAEVTFERQWLLNMSARRQEAQRHKAEALTHGESATVVKRKEAAKNKAFVEDKELTALARMEWRYRLKPKKTASVESRLEQLLLRVDVVPASLVLAQAAKESGWGTSRFAREGNNFFGIWCFYKACGMTPERRDQGRFHEVAMFDTVEDGVRYYIRTLNSHVAYNGLRETRAVARQHNEPFAGEELASGLLRYSERGLMYVNEIQSMIRYNRLQRFTREWRA
jgi:Bax protein